MTVRYIAVEGVDGVGKTTVSKRLVARFEDAGRDVRFVREPGGTTTSAMPALVGAKASPKDSKSSRIFR